MLEQRQHARGGEEREAGGGGDRDVVAAEGVVRGAGEPGPEQRADAGAGVEAADDAGDGARAVSGIIGCLYTGAGIGTLLGPWLSGAAYDALGSYDVPILAAAAFAFVAAAAVVPLLKDEGKAA